MAHKFGKFLLFSAAAGAIAAGTYYFLQNKDKFLNKDTTDDADDDYDDFSEDLDAEPERSYVPLNADAGDMASAVKETAEDVADAVTGKAEDIVSSVSDTVEEVAEEAAETVEEFFDEEDPSNE